MNEVTQILGQSANGANVVFDPVHSHAATHLDDTPGLRDAFIEVLGKMELDGSEVEGDVDVGKIIGTSDAVSVNSSDEIVYAQRKNRPKEGLVPFVKNRNAEDCSTLAFNLRPIDPQTYELFSVWIGVFDDTPFPGEATANEQSIPYWSRHASSTGVKKFLLAVKRAYALGDYTPT